MQFFYDGQIRRYITQIVRAFSNFSYKDGDGDLRRVPVMYGDISRQVASIIRENSENKIPSAPRMGVYITSLQMDRARLSDSSFISKINLREKEFDQETNSYVAAQAKGYTVERLHPTPYTLSVNVDVWSTSTDQKLQILEQIFMLFNPDMEFQTNDNYIDWTSLTFLYLEDINFSSRTIPVGTQDEIDVATLGFTAPIYVSPPTKVKKLGIITDIITSVYDQTAGTISLEGFNPPTSGDQGAASGTTVLPDGTIVGQDSNNSSIVGITSGQLDLSNPQVTSYRNFDIIVEDETAKLAINRKLRLGEITWLNVLEAELPSKYQPNISQIRLRRAELNTEIIGTFEIRENDSFIMDITWDQDTLPSNTIITGPVTTSGTVDYIVDPIKFNPENIKTPGVRVLTLGPLGYKVDRAFTATTKTNRIDTDLDFLIDDQSISASLGSRVGDETVTSFRVLVNGTEVSATGSNVNDKFVIILDASYDIGDKVQYILSLNEDGAAAWKNADNTDFTADANDICEWDGTKWNIIWDASANNTTTYITNVTTGQQFYWNNYYWQSAVDGLYPRGTWTIVL
jgi:hypothetical protein